MSIGDVGSLFGNSVKAGRLVRSTNIYNDIRPSKIINEKQNYIGSDFSFTPMEILPKSM